MTYLIQTDLMKDQSNLLNIVNFLDDDWEYDFKRPHLEGLGKYSFLLCVEPPVTIDIPLRKRKTFHQWLTGKKRLRQLGDSLFLYKPVVFVPYSVSMRFAFLKPVNRFLMRRSLRKVLRKLSMRDLVVMLSHPAQDYVIGMLGEHVLCYEVYDEYSKCLSSSMTMRKLSGEVEKNILAQADIVFTSANNLAESKRKLNPTTHFVPNTADVTFFTKSLDPGTAIPEDLARIQEPRIGLIGNINEILDIELINYLAEKRPQWSIVLIGAINGSSRFLRGTAYLKSCRLPNVYYLGWRDYETLPSYQKGLNVCLLPYLINEYTVNVYPSKLHQYLSGGRPVVSTDMPEMRPFSDVVAIAKDHAEFLKLVEEAIYDTSDIKVSHRVEIAKANSIERRAETKIELLTEILDAKKRKERLFQDRSLSCNKVVPGGSYL